MKIEEKEDIGQRWIMPKKDRVKGKRTKPLDVNKLKSIMESTAVKVSDSNTIMRLLPDVSVAQEILVANILSPKDLLLTRLNIGLDKGAPAEMAEVIRKHFTTVYNLNSKLPDILGKAIFTDGSYTVITLPPHLVSRIINENSIGVENYKAQSGAPIGLLRRSNVPFGLESLSNVVEGGDGKERLLDITDNPYSLIRPALASVNRAENVDAVLSSFYGVASLNTAKATNVYLKRNFKPANTIDIPPIKDEGRQSETLNPLIITPPPESIIPVTVPGEPDNLVGVFIVHDENGYPIHKTRDSNYFKDLEDRLKSVAGIGAGSNVISSTLKVSVNKNNSGTEFIKPILDSYINLFEKELAEAVEGGTHGEMVNIGRADELYRLMLSRQLAGQKTKVVYLPKELVTYIAFNYNEMGIGESLLERTKLYSSLRIVLTLARTIAGVQNSIPGKELDITLDESDPDQQNTLEKIIDIYLGMQTRSVPIGHIDPASIFNELQRAGIRVKINGGDMFPGTSLDVSDVSSNVSAPDDELLERLERAHYNGLWVTPESVNNALQGEYATGLVYNNMINAKRVLNLQNKFGLIHLSTLIRNYINCGGPLYAELNRIYEKTKVKDGLTLEAIIGSVVVNLPSPVSAMVEQQMALFDDYSDFVDKAVELYVTEDIIGGMLEGDNIGKSLQDIQMAVGSVIKRQYLRSENVLPELEELFYTDDSVGLEEAITSHNEKVIDLAAIVYSHITKVEHKADKRVEKVKNKLDEDESVPEDKADEPPKNDKEDESVSKDKADEPPENDNDGSELDDI